MSLESLEWWKSVFEIGGVVLLLLTFFAGAGVLWFSKKLNVLQSTQLRQFDKDLTAAKLSLAEQQERAANADARANEADLKIAEAQRGSAEANARAKKAQESLGLAEQHSAEANAKAEGFRLDIAKANMSAAQAQAQVARATAEAAKATLELAKLKTPRFLSKEQQDRITDKLKLFPNTPFDLWVNTDSDSTNLLNLIDEAIRAAKWDFKVAGIITFAGKAGVIAGSGVSVHFADEHRDKLENPATALGHALMAEGILTKIYRDLAEAEKDKDRTRIHVMIGSKPLN